MQEEYTDTHDDILFWEDNRTPTNVPGLGYTISLWMIDKKL